MLRRTGYDTGKNGLLEPRSAWSAQRRVQLEVVLFWTVDFGMFDHATRLHPKGEPAPKDRIKLYQIVHFELQMLCLQSTTLPSCICSFAGYWHKLFLNVSHALHVSVAGRKHSLQFCFDPGRYLRAGLYKLLSSLGFANRLDLIVFANSQHHPADTPRK